MIPDKTIDPPVRTRALHKLAAPDKVAGSVCKILPARRVTLNAGDFSSPLLIGFHAISIEIRVEFESMHRSLLGLVSIATESFHKLHQELIRRFEK